jgi:hypothetical protein
MTLPDLMSQWRTPRLWAKATASQTFKKDVEAAVQALGVAGGLAAMRRRAAALDALHGEEEAAVGVAAELVDRCDVGVLELAGDLGLADEAVDEQVVAVRRSWRTLATMWRWRAVSKATRTEPTPPAASSSPMRRRSIVAGRTESTSERVRGSRGGALDGGHACKWEVVVRRCRGGWRPWWRCSGSRRPTRRQDCVPWYQARVCQRMKVQGLRRLLQMFRQPRGEAVDPAA